MKVLVIQQRIPEPDRNSGDLRLLEIIRLLNQGGHEVIFLGMSCTDQRYIDSLETAGIRVILDRKRNSCNWDWMQSFAFELKPDCVILLTYATYNLYEFPLRQALPNCALVLDTVDLHHIRAQREADLFEDARLRSQAEMIKKQEWLAIRDADAVWVVTDVESGLLNSVPCVRVIPNIHRSAEIEPSFHNRKGLIFLGGYQHLPNVDAVNYFMKEIYPSINAKIPGVPVTIAGSDPPEMFRAIPARWPQVTITGYVQEHRDLLLRHRVSLAPLRYGAGMKGKIGEYLCCGTPCVSTSIGVEGTGLMPGENIMLADNPQDFTDAVVRLYQDEVFWGKMSIASRSFMRRYSPEAVQKQLLEAIVSAVKERNRRQRWRHRLPRMVWKKALSIVRRRCAK